MFIFILLIVIGIVLIVGSSTERHVMHDVDHIAKENEKIMWKEIEKSNERWKKSQ